MTIFLC